jgi:5-methyltetrahydropteroyltriglutamate--homocysteine methyltransferase
VSANGHFLPHDFSVAQALTDKPIKITLPGPMTIGDTVADNYYHDEKKRGEDLATALNAEVLALAEAGCRHIQVDEPLFARKSKEALAFGIDNLERVFHGCPEGVTRTMHMCCGYPDGLDSTDYPKAPMESYGQLAGAIDASSIMAVSLEDAHRHNDLSLLDTFKDTTVILGVVAIASSRIETVEEIRQRLIGALEHIAPHRLIAAPDCGLGMLDRDSVIAKLNNLCEAAHRIGS